MADIRLAKPAPNTAQNIPSTPEGHFIFDFSTGEATLSRDGDDLLLSFEDGVVRFELLGRCSGCPAANITTEELIRETLRQEVAAVKDVVLVEEVDEDLVAQARAILRRPRC